MIKKTLYFANPTRLTLRNRQLMIELADNQKTSVPIEDIGMVIMDHPQITFTQGTMQQLILANVPVVTCDEKHLPVGLMLNFGGGHHLHSARSAVQISAKNTLKKQLWAQTVRAKILNQAAVLEQTGVDASLMQKFADDVRSGDSTNREGIAAKWYWERLFDYTLEFNRAPDGEAPNNLLNYGYAIVRTTLARCIVGTGLLPVLGIFHRNQYNPFCLADDLMEPYRPMVDRLVLEIVGEGTETETLTKEIKARLLELPAMGVQIGTKRYPMMIAAESTAYSFYQCLAGEASQIAYPTFQDHVRT